MLTRRQKIVVAAAVLVAGPGLQAAGEPADEKEQVSPAATPSRTQPAATGGEFPDGWYYRGSRRPSALREMEGKPAPPLAVGDWIGDPADIEGKVAVVEFWGTWCGTCRRSISKNTSLVRKYATSGVVFVGVHDSTRGVDRIPQTISKYGINYPVCVDRKRASERAWNVSFWPTYAVIDTGGIVRAIGLDPTYVEKVVSVVLGGEASNAEVVEDACLEGSRASRAERLGELLARETPPPITGVDWVNSEPVDLAALKNKIVVLHFWPPDDRLASRIIRRTLVLHQQYEKYGVVVIGIARTPPPVPLSAVVGKMRLPYANCVDDGGRTAAAYGVDGTSDYYVIGRTGRMHAADVSDGCVQRVIREIIAAEVRTLRGRDVPSNAEKPDKTETPPAGGG